jgi:hypothetical protein
MNMAWPIAPVNDGPKSHSSASNSFSFDREAHFDQDLRIAGRRRGNANIPVGPIRLCQMLMPVYAVTSRAKPAASLSFKTAQHDGCHIGWHVKQVRATTQAVTKMRRSAQGERKFDKNSRFD